MTFACGRCGFAFDATPALWRCTRCHGPLSVEHPPLTDEELGRRRPVSLGEPVTPLLDLDWDGREVTLKLEGALPTGSFKDRGAAALVAWLAEHGVERVHEDSSGNAGAALAAYCARAGIACDVYVPEAAAPAKLAQIAAYGARIVPVPGPRPRATEAAEALAEEGTSIYASHVWSPLFVAGTQTFAFELWAQLDGELPDVVVFPVGGGSLILGAHVGFRRLEEAGLIDRVPRLVCAQAAACAPLVAAFAARSPAPAPVEMAPSVADGIAIPRPVHGGGVLRTLTVTGGTAVAVSEDEIVDAHRQLAARGVLVEMTSAVAMAALAKRGVAWEGERVVVAITGHGLKTPPGA